MINGHDYDFSFHQHVFPFSIVVCYSRSIMCVPPLTPAVFFVLRMHTYYSDLVVPLMKIQLCSAHCILSTTHVSTRITGPRLLSRQKGCGEGASPQKYETAYALVYAHLID